MYLNIVIQGFLCHVSTRIQKSLGKNSFKVQVEGQSNEGAYCRVWVQVLDRYDGTYVARWGRHSFH